jgi:hypothetical protein
MAFQRHESTHISSMKFPPCLRFRIGGMPALLLVVSKPSESWRKIYYDLYTHYRVLFIRQSIVKVGQSCRKYTESLIV